MWDTSEDVACHDLVRIHRFYNYKKKVKDFMLSTFLAEAVMKKKSSRRLLNPIFDTVVESIDKPDGKKRIAQNVLRYYLWTSHVEKGEVRVVVSRRRTVFHAMMGTLDARVNLDIAGKEVLCLLVTGGKYVLSGQYCLDQTEHIDFEVRGCQSPTFIVLDSGSEAICLSLCPAWHIYGHYQISLKKKLSQMLRLEVVTIPTYSVSVRHEYLQHGGCDRRGSHSLQYHTYLIASTYNLKDSVVCAFGASFSVFKRPVPHARKKGRNRLLAEPVCPIERAESIIMTSLLKNGDGINLPLQIA